MVIQKKKEKRISLLYVCPSTIAGTRRTNVLSFAHMFYFSPKLLFGSKVSLTFTSIVIHTHPVKKVTTRLESLTRVGCLTGISTDVCSSATQQCGQDVRQET